MTRRKVVKFASMGIVLGIALGIVLSILALNLFIRLGDYSWLQHLLRFEAAKECVDQGNNNKLVEAIRQRGAPGVRLLLEQGEDAQQEINCFGDTPYSRPSFRSSGVNPGPTDLRYSSSSSSMEPTSTTSTTSTEPRCTMQCL